MNATSISFGLLVALLAILLLHKIRKLKPQVVGYGSQKDVSVLRVNHIPTKGLLLGVWSVSYGGSVTPVIEKWSGGGHHSQRGFNRQKSEA